MLMVKSPPPPVGGFADVVAIVVGFVTDVTEKEVKLVSSAISIHLAINVLFWLNLLGEDHQYDGS